MFKDDPKYIWYRKNVSKILKREMGCSIADCTEPYPGMVMGNYAMGIDPEITAMDIIEVNVSLGNI